jgi:protoporphyrinogen oxidase
MIKQDKHSQVTIVGGGFTGLAAAYELARHGVKVTLLEAESEIGGLAASFDVHGEKLERFYHHWFTNDIEVTQLIEELGLTSKIEVNPTNTGIYFSNRFYKLSTPWDLLKFTPLSIFSRLRLGAMTLRARRVKDWKRLEDKTAHEWLRELGGEDVYRVIWQPLLTGKFGPYAKRVSAVWFWSKLKLRGGSRGKSGEERLAYFKGGFAGLAEAIVNQILDFGGRIELNALVKKIERIEGRWHIDTEQGIFTSDKVIVTTALPLLAKMIEDWAPPQYINELNRIKYIGNVCLVLELNRSLSSTYWLNVNDPSFPFVGIIEHTNFERPETYAGRHIVYISKYLPHTDQLYAMDPDGFLEYALPYLQKMFPKMEKSWIKARHLWRARWSQPIVEKYYSKLIPQEDTPFEGLHICTMAQIYPEDRGTNYAIREGRRIAAKLIRQL